MRPATVRSSPRRLNALISIGGPGIMLGPIVNAIRASHAFQKPNLAQHPYKLSGIAGPAGRYLQIFVGQSLKVTVIAVVSDP